MSLKKLSLDPYLIAQLYKAPLISPVAMSLKPEVPPLSFLGSNKKKVVVFIKNDTNPWLPDDLFGFLTNILQACRLNMDDIALVNIPRNKNRNLKDYIEELKPKKIMFLGPYFEKWGNRPMAKNTIEKIGEIDSLWSFSLKEMQTDKQAKKIFWQNLQLLFNLKK